MKKVIDWILRIFGVILIIALILFAGWAIRGCTATPVVATETTAAATAAPVETTAATTAATVETVTAETAATAVASNGIDYPSKTWLFVQSGTVVSGDIAVFDNDNNSKKTPIYDSAEGTADIIYFTQDIYIWAEWGCHVVANPTQDQIDNLINSKLQEFRTVRYFSNFTKLGENTPIIYGEALPAA